MGTYSAATFAVEAYSQALRPEVAPFGMTVR
jgi:short-subunit dehydrogenase